MLHTSYIPYIGQNFKFIRAERTACLYSLPLSNLYPYLTSSATLLVVRLILIRFNYYFQAYFEEVPNAFLSYIDEMRNCEDIAMAHTVAKMVLYALRLLSSHLLT